MLKQKNTMGLTALIFVLCLVTGSLVAGTLLERSGMDSNRIYLTGAEGENPLLSISKNRALETLRSMKLETADGNSIWDTRSDVELFKISYDGKNGTASVKSSTSDHVIAPGTGNDYRFILKNRERSSVSYTMRMEAKTEPEGLELPLKVRVSDSAGWILGDENNWKNPADLNQVKKKGTLAHGGQNQYTLSWQWPYEQGADELDTALGKRAGQEDLTFTVTIYTQATVVSGGGSSSGSGGSSGRRETVAAGTQTLPQTQETAAAAPENTAAAETTAAETAGVRNTQTEEKEQTSGEGTGGGTAGTEAASGREDGQTSGNRAADETDSHNRAENGKENAAGSEKTKSGMSGSLLAAAAGGTSLLGLALLVLLWPRGIYLTGFAAGAYGGRMDWRRKSDRIRSDGRFVFHHMPFGKHTWKVVSPDGRERKFIWRLKRGSAEGVGFGTENGIPVVTVGRNVRAVELYLDTTGGEICMDTVRWAAVDGSKNVYTPGKVEAPKDDGTNATPGGLRVDENKKFSFNDSERQ